MKIIEAFRRVLYKKPDYDFATALKIQQKRINRSEEQTLSEKDALVELILELSQEIRTHSSADKENWQQIQSLLALLRFYQAYFFQNNIADFLQSTIKELEKINRRYSQTFEKSLDVQDQLLAALFQQWINVLMPIEVAIKSQDC